MQARKAEGHVNYDVTESQEAVVIFLLLSNLSVVSRFRHV